MMSQSDLFHFTLKGFYLQEPLTFLSDWLISFFCFRIFFQMKKNSFLRNNFFQKFFFFLGLSTLLGGVSHLFHHYFGVVGHFPSWIFSSVSTYYFCIGMMQMCFEKQNTSLYRLVLFKSLFLLILSLYTQKFLFVSIDAILSFLFFGGILGLRFYFEKVENEFIKHLLYGVLVLIPAGIVFLFKFDLHILFNRNDLSHVFILLSVFLFNKSFRKRSQIVSVEH